MNLKLSRKADMESWSGQHDTPTATLEDEDDKYTLESLGERSCEGRGRDGVRRCNEKIVTAPRTSNFLRNAYSWESMI